MPIDMCIYPYHRVLVPAPGEWVIGDGGPEMFSHLVSIELLPGPLLNPLSSFEKMFFLLRLGHHLIWFPFRGPVAGVPPLACPVPDYSKPSTVYRDTFGIRDFSQAPLIQPVYLKAHFLHQRANLRVCNAMTQSKIVRFGVRVNPHACNS